ncbi:MAG: thermonuclease family protein [Polyangia bacterium]|jgi:micrococcal nuclease|nr:thermonuclease family protein [Polyangia bacterium]
MRLSPWILAPALLGPVVAACSDDDAENRCGPRRATVSNIVDGDTVDLSTGERVRLLMVDTPETTGGANDCYGQEAKQYTMSALLGQEVELGYDVQCEDQYGRLLAYVSVQGREFNALLVERGYACVLYIPPNGQDRRDEYETLEYLARTNGVGMWGACAEVTCD